MFGLSHTRHRQTPQSEINSPLPRLTGIPIPLAGEWILRQARSVSDCPVFRIVEIGDFGMKDKAQNASQYVNVCDGMATLRRNHRRGRARKAGRLIFAKIAVFPVIASGRPEIFPRNGDWGSEAHADAEEGVVVEDGVGGVEAAEGGGQLDGGSAVVGAAGQ